MVDWRGKLFQAALLVLAVAVIGHVAWVLLNPLVPVVVALVALGTIYTFLFRHRRK